MRCHLDIPPTHSSGVILKNTAGHVLGGDRVTIAKRILAATAGRDMQAHVPPCVGR